jgi:hypothetical protein
LYVYPLKLIDRIIAICEFFNMSWTFPLFFVGEPKSEPEEVLVESKFLPHRMVKAAGNK